MARKSNQNANGVNQIKEEEEKEKKKRRRKRSVGSSLTGKVVPSALND